MSISLDIENPAGPLLSLFLAGLSDRSRLHQDIATRAEVVTRNHLIQVANSNHKTANRLGATPTGHLSRAAESVTSVGGPGGAVVTVTSPGIARVAGPITIRPVNRKALTIPARKEAYGIRAGEFAARQGVKLFVREGRNGAYLAYREPGGRGGKGALRVAYFLRKSVTLPQERGLLPSDTAYQDAALAGCEDFVDRLIAASK